MSLYLQCSSKAKSSAPCLKWAQPQLLFKSTWDLSASLDLDYTRPQLFRRMLQHSFGCEAPEMICRLSKCPCNGLLNMTMLLFCVHHHCIFDMFGLTNSYP